jgi:hypothetical protein
MACKNQLSLLKFFPILLIVRCTPGVVAILVPHGYPLLICAFYSFASELAALLQFFFEQPSTPGAEPLAFFAACAHRGFQDIDDLASIPEVECLIVVSKLLQNDQNFRPP